MLVFLLMLSLANQGMKFHWLLWTFVTILSCAEIIKEVSEWVDWWFGCKRTTPSASDRVRDHFVRR